jgi:hypothetical protein
LIEVSVTPIVTPWAWWLGHVDLTLCVSGPLLLQLFITSSRALCVVLQLLLPSCHVSTLLCLLCLLLLLLQWFSLLLARLLQPTSLLCCCCALCFCLILPP